MKLISNKEYLMLKEAKENEAMVSVLEHRASNDLSYHKKNCWEIKNSITR